MTASTTSRPGKGRRSSRAASALALVLVIAGHTVGEALVPFSTHSAFSRAGVSTLPVEISVERDSDSRRFARRRVRFSQEGRVFFWSDVCFHRHDPDDGWQQSSPEMPPPAEMASAPMFVPVPVMEVRPLAGPASSVLSEWCSRRGSDSRVVYRRHRSGVPRPRRGRPTMPSRFRCSLPAVGRRTGPRALTLEHSMWFHRPVDPVDWLLVNMTPASLADQRYLATGTIHTESGVLASTIVQAGMFLPDPGF